MVDAEKALQWTAAARTSRLSANLEALTSKAEPTDARETASGAVLPQVDRAQRIGAMLDRWETEDVADEPAWDVATLEPLRLRSRVSGS